MILRLINLRILPDVNQDNFMNYDFHCFRSFLCSVSSASEVHCSHVELQEMSLCELFRAEWTR